METARKYGDRISFVLAVLAFTPPQDRITWQQGCPLSTARLIEYLSEWAILEKACKN